MSALVMGALILSHLNRRNGNDLMSWAWLAIAAAACGAHAWQVLA